LALYLTLEALHDQMVVDVPMSHEQLLRHAQMTVNDMSLAKAQLEAVGLLKSYVREKEGYAEWIYEIYAPKSPQEFFADVIFEGMLKTILGVEEAQRLRLSYAAPQPLEGYRDMSASFAEIFHPDFNQPSFKTAPGTPVIGRQPGTPLTSFDRAAFIDEIKRTSQINPDVFSDGLLDELASKAGLYGLDELALAELVISASTGRAAAPIDFRRLNELMALETRFPFAKTRRQAKTNITSTTNKAKKIRLMEETSPLAYFRLRNFNNPPAPSDVRILEDIQKNYDLPLSVINALIDYVLEVANLTFPRALVEKVASSLARSRAGGALEAMEYLKKTTRRKPSRPSEPDQTPKPTEETIDIDALLAAFEKDKGGQ